MSEKESRNPIRRLVGDMSQSEGDVRDWVNGNGAIPMAVIGVLIVLALLAVVFLG